jgi:hypothetical protein
MYSKNTFIAFCVNIVNILAIVLYAIIVFICIKCRMHFKKSVVGDWALKIQLKENKKEKTKSYTTLINTSFNSNLAL